MALKAFVNVRQNDWDERVADAVVAINTANHATTAATPFEIVYGRAADLPHERLWRMGFRPMSVS